MTDFFLYSPVAILYLHFVGGHLYLLFASLLASDLLDGWHSARLVEHYDTGWATPILI